MRETTLTPAQREAFEALRRRRWVRRLGDGLTWGAGRMWSLSDGILRGDGEDLTAAVFEAWTGTPALPRTPAPDLEPELDLEPEDPSRPAAEVDQDELNALNPPELWFWHHALDEDELVDRVATALPQYEVEYDEMAQERWRPIVAYPPAGVTDQESLLQDLRKAVVTVEPDWAALQPRAGSPSPASTRTCPASGVLDHPWVRRQWIGDRPGGAAGGAGSRHPRRGRRRVALRHRPRPPGAADRRHAVGLVGRAVRRGGRGRPHPR